MRLREFGKTFEELIGIVANETVITLAKELPSAERLKSLEDRTKSIEVTLNHILKKAGGMPLRKSKRGRKPGLQRICKNKECDRPVVARGLCSMHYQRARAAELRKKSFRQIEKKRKNT